MRVADALSQYRGNRQLLVEKTRYLAQQRDAAEKKYEETGNEGWSIQAATLQLSVEASDSEFKKNQDVLDSLMNQYVAAWNAEVARANADPETGMAAQLSKIMKTIARMCAGDKVPASDEQKVMEYDKDMYAKAKQAQLAMAQLKKKQKEYESAWDDEEGGEYDPEAAAENAQVYGDLPEIQTDGFGEMEDFSVDMPEGGIE